MEKEALREEVLRLGAYRAEFIETERIEADASFRKLCESNACGNYGRSYMCPPDVGEVETLMGRLKDYRLALVYQTVGTLEDSYDFEGMMEAGKRHNDLAQQVRRLAEQLDCEKTLHLGAAAGCVTSAVKRQATRAGIRSRQCLPWRPMESTFQRWLRSAECAISTARIR